jgi:hypothetical protein
MRGRNAARRRGWAFGAGSALRAWKGGCYKAERAGGQWRRFFFVFCVRIESGESGGLRLTALWSARDARRAQDDTVRDSAAAEARVVPRAHNRESCGQGDVFSLCRKSGPIPFARFLREANLMALERQMRPAQAIDSPPAPPAQEATRARADRPAARPAAPAAEVMKRAQDAYQARVLTPAGRYIDIWI